jgi:hypothetical protein
MDPELRTRFRKLEAANKKVSIENRRLAREVIDLQARLEKLEATVPPAVKLAKANDQMVRKLQGVVVKLIRAVRRLQARLTKARPRPAVARRSK